MRRFSWLVMGLVLLGALLVGLQPDDTPRVVEQRAVRLGDPALGALERDRRAEAPRGLAGDRLGSALARLDESAGHVPLALLRLAGAAQRQELAVAVDPGLNGRRRVVVVDPAAVRAGRPGGVEGRSG